MIKAKHYSKTAQMICSKCKELAKVSEFALGRIPAISPKKKHGAFHFLHIWEKMANVVEMQKDDKQMNIICK